jgi:hypothetical protein
MRVLKQDFCTSAWLQAVSMAMEADTCDFNRSGIQYDVKQGSYWVLCLSCAYYVLYLSVGVCSCP